MYHLHKMEIDIIIQVFLSFFVLKKICYCVTLMLRAVKLDKLQLESAS